MLKREAVLGLLVCHVGVDKGGLETTSSAWGLGVEPWGQLQLGRVEVTTQCLVLDTEAHSLCNLPPADGHVAPRVVEELDRGLSC